MASKFPVYMPDRDQALFGLSIALSVLDTLILGLRFWSRFLCDNKFRGDDWTALLAWPLVLGTGLCCALAMRHGFGTQFTNIIASDPAAVPSILIITYVGELIWVFGIGIIRSSALLFYDRLFHIAHVGFRKFVIAGIIANILFSTILGFVCIFQCSPVAGYWEKTLHPTCLSTLKIELASGITSILLDLYTLILPMPIIWGLHMNRGKKALTTLLFLLSYCVIICTIGRTVTVVKTGKKINEDLSWYFPDILYWVIIELAIAHSCISLPSLLTLYQRVKRNNFSSLFSRSTSKTPMNVYKH